MRDTDETPESSAGPENLMEAAMAASPAGEEATRPTDVEAESSTVTDADADSSSADDVKAESSPAGEAEDAESESMLEAATAALKPDEEKAEAPGESPPPEEQDPTAEASEESDDEPLPFDKHPRFRELVRERNEFKQDAEQYRQVQTFLDNNELTPADAADALGMAAMFQSALRGKVQPQEALKVLDGYRSQILSLTGDELPEDIQQRLDDGDTDELTARELASVRAQQQILKREAERQATLQQERAQAEAAQKTQNEVRAEVTKWEQATRSSDPDYDKKARLIPAFLREIAATKGPPKSTAEALEYTQQAYSDVTEYLSGVIPKPRATPKTPPSEGGASAGAPEPSSMMEAAQLGLERSRQAML